MATDQSHIKPIDASTIPALANMEKVRDILEASGFPVFHGRPNV